MANAYRGITTMTFGANSTTSTIIVGKIQSIDHEYKNEVASVKDADGKTVARAYYDFNEEATFEYYATEVNPTITSNGTLCTITDATVTGIAGTTWIVESMSSKVTNTDYYKITLKISKWPGISA
jgi:hypothetical protein